MVPYVYRKGMRGNTAYLQSTELVQRWGQREYNEKWIQNSTKNISKYEWRSLLYNNWTIFSLGKRMSENNPHNIHINFSRSHMYFLDASCWKLYKTLWCACTKDKSLWRSSTCGELVIEKQNCTAIWITAPYNCSHLWHIIWQHWIWCESLINVFILIHPSIFHNCLSLSGSCGGLEPTPADIAWDVHPVHVAKFITGLAPRHKQSLTPTFTPINANCMC